MFGYIQANLSMLTPEEQMRYRSAYCGLCHALGERHGFASRLSLTYDHRALDGGEATRFVKEVANEIEAIDFEL